jgi:PBP1b-binding outer membrane lipoprotein LpoB
LVRRGTSPVAAIACAVLLLTSCSSDGIDRAESVTRQTTTTTTAPANTDAMCELFGEIAAGAQAAKVAPGDPSAVFTAEQWEEKIATTAKIVDVVPAEHRAEAETYLQLVKARSELAATYDYGVVPTDARQQFIGAHGSQQQEANKLLAFVRQSCNLPALAQ